ncbi:hypothetical protein HON22_02040 [Candidatus Peregrinibacteria bacterium]|jgi:hypothetical protein|nr:hypothetical protein [Candidatus Peregrinibacteria bacterium]
MKFSLSGSSKTILNLSLSFFLIVFSLQMYSGNMPSKLLSKYTSNNSSGFVETAFAAEALVKECFWDGDFLDTVNFDQPWSTWYMPFVRQSFNSDDPGETPYRAFIDINGDSLVDFMYKRQVTTSQGLTAKQDCVMLNTGSGWNIAFSCENSSSNVNAYRGTCTT